MVGKLKANSYIAALKINNTKQYKNNMVKFLKRSLYSLLFIFPLLLGTQDAKATHVMGADITYKCIDSCTYQFEVVYYRSCAGVPLSTPQATLQCISSGGSISSSRGLALNLVVIKEITPVCRTEGARCNPTNTRLPGVTGIEQHVYTGTLDLCGADSIYKNCDRIRLQTGQCCRNSDITTGGANQNFQTFADIYIGRVPCNSSPALTSEPIAILCCNQPFYFNNGAVDVFDFDSVSYSWSPPRGNNLAAIPYSAAPLSFQNPFTAFFQPLRNPALKLPNATPPVGIYLDPLTGDVILTPTKCDEITVAVIEMTEWRKDSTGVQQIIGVTRRDMQFIVQNCPDNNPPKIKPNYSYDVCEGNQLCFNVETEDFPFIPPPPALPPPADTVSISWNRGIPGATFTVINPTARLQTGRFCWTPDAGSASDVPYTFTVTARDNACPLNAVTVRGFRVVVKPRAQGTIDIDTLICGKYAFRADPIDGFRGTPSYQWTLLDSTQNILFDSRIAKFQSTNGPFSGRRNDTIQFTRGGMYIIQHQLNNSQNCPTTYSDTLIVPPLIETDLTLGPDTFVCAGTSVEFSPIIINETPPVTYQWSSMGVTNEGEFLNNATTEIADTLNTFTMSVPSVQYDTAVAVLITDALGCTTSDTVQIFLKANPKAVLPPDMRICTYDSITLVPNLDTAYWVDPIQGDTLVQGDTLLKKWYSSATFGQFSTADSVTINEPGQYVIEVTDSLGCMDTDTFILFVNDTVVAEAGLNQVICINDSFYIEASGLDTVNNLNSGFYNWSDITATPIIDLGTANIIGVEATVDKQYWLELSINQGGTVCIDDDTMEVFINPLPIITLGDDQDLCCDDGDVFLRFINQTPPSNSPTGGWFSKLNPELVANNLFFTDSACSLINFPAERFKIFNATYGYTDPATQCYNEDSIRIQVNSVPSIILEERIFCQDIGSFSLGEEVVLSPANLNLGSSEWKCLECNGNTFEGNMLENRGPSFAPIWWLNIGLDKYTPKNPFKDTVTLEFTYTNENNCFGRDTISIEIWKLPVIEFNAGRDLCYDEGEIELDNLFDINITTGTWECYDSIGYRSCGALGGILGDTINTLNSIELSNPIPPVNKFYLRYTDISTGCFAFNDTTLVINPLPDITITDFSPRDVFCENRDPLSLSAIPSGGSWSAEDAGILVGSNQVDPGSAAIFSRKTNIYYDYQDPVTGCISRDSIDIQIDPEPTIQVPADTSFCNLTSASTQLQFNITATNVSSLTWVPTNVYGNSDRIALADADPSINNTLTLTTQNDSTETFRIGALAGPLGACSGTDGSFEITVFPRPEGRLVNPDSAGCNPLDAGFSVSLTNEIDEIASTYEWNLGNGNVPTGPTASLTFDQDGTQPISVTVTSENGCVSTFTNRVEVYPIPVASFRPTPDNYTTAALPRFSFDASTSTIADINGASIVEYSWDFGDPDATTAEGITALFNYPPDTGSYNVRLQVVSNKGCVNDTVYPVFVGPDLIVFIPNAFTPNQSGPEFNEGFRPIVSGEKFMEFLVFNRWGEIVYKTTGNGESWDGIYKGELAQQDVYAYQLKVTALNDEVYTYTGTVTLIR